MIEPEPKMFSNADSYEFFMGRWSALLAPLLAEFGRVPDRGLVLDVGSGLGSLSFAIARRNKGVQVRGIDPSPEFIAFAARQNPYPERVGFEAADALRLGFADRAFDACSSLLAFNFIATPDRALSEVMRVTKPGGWVSAAVWDYGAGMRMLREFWDAAATLDENARRRDESNMPLCRAGELSKLWREAGLEEVDEQPLGIVMDFESFADFWEPCLRGLGPAGVYVHELDEESRAALRQAVKSRLEVLDPEKPFSLPARAWAVRGVVPRAV